jgi:hypothetical protein
MNRRQLITSGMAAAVVAASAAPARAQAGNEQDLVLLTVTGTYSATPISV